MLIPEFCGGLGNMMFQLASGYGIAKKTGHEFGIHSIPVPPIQHSTTDYTENIFRPWLQFTTNKTCGKTLKEQNMQPIDMQWFVNNRDSVISLKGYFQNETYIRDYRDEIVNLFDLSVPKNILEKYNDIDEAYFIHVRRGDYVNNSFHQLNLDDYYKKTVAEMTGVAYIVSNDIEWCEEWKFLDDIRYRFVNERDDYTLAIMSKCGHGGIAVNSSFGWWGLYLNLNRPKLFIPDRWFPHNIVRQDGYRFKEAMVVSV